MGFKKEEERHLLLKLWDLINKADIVIAQNGDSFDIKVINNRLLVHKFTPPSPYKTIDTLKILRKNFSFASNKLDHVGQDLEEGRKVAHRGFDMWKGCLAGNKKDQNTMVKYNIGDVDLLVRIYKRIRAWHRNHPVIYMNECPIDGGKLQRRGVLQTKFRRYARLCCTTCGAWTKRMID